MAPFPKDIMLKSCLSGFIIQLTILNNNSTVGKFFGGQLFFTTMEFLSLE
jgi:hypothetical protein